MRIEPAGMTYERALQIAIASDSRHRFDMHSWRATPTGEGTTGNRLMAESRAEVVRLLRLSWRAEAVAAAVGCTERTVQRIRAQVESDAAWESDQRRQECRESYRHMTEEWTEIA